MRDEGQGGRQGPKSEHPKCAGAAPPELLSSHSLCENPDPLPSTPRYPGDLWGKGCG